jgi:hypothetical protein
VDSLNTLFLTPLPGTRLWDQMTAEGRVVLDRFPKDWQYYTLTFPVARYKGLSQDQAIEEMLACDRHFYALPRILRRVWKNVWHRRQPLINLFGSLSYRKNLELNRTAYAAFSLECATRLMTREIWDSGLEGGIRAPVPSAAETLA